MFGLVSIDSVEIKFPSKGKDSPYAYNYPGDRHATSIVESVGMFLFALYHVVIIIVLINMLIAMMSHSFEDIQTDCDVEWKFARTRLWLNYMDQGGTLPVPFNMILTPKTCRYAWHWVTSFLNSAGNSKLIGGVSRLPSENEELLRNDKKQEKFKGAMNDNTSHTSYSDILQRLVRRYMFKLERLKEEGKESVTVGAESVISTKTISTSNNGTIEQLTTAADEHAAYSNTDDQQSRPQPTSLVSNNDEHQRDLSTLHVPSSPRTSASNAVVRARVGRFSQSSAGGGSVSAASSTAAAAAATAAAPTNASVHLVSLPQLDSIQRTLRLLDVRMQHVQLNALDDVERRADIEHVRRLMTENQDALLTVVTVLSSIQEEVRRISIGVHEQRQQQANPMLLVQPPNHRQHRQLSGSLLSGRPAPTNPREADFTIAVDESPMTNVRPALATRACLGSAESAGTNV